MLCSAGISVYLPLSPQPRLKGGTPGCWLSLDSLCLLQITLICVCVRVCICVYMCENMHVCYVGCVYACVNMYMYVSVYVCVQCV